MRIQVWTDGCCLKNPGGAGGWAALVVVDGSVVARQSGGMEDTTNNVMEMMAVLRGIGAVEWLFPGEAFEIVSDSQYVVNGINKWMWNWKRNGWKRKGRNGKSKPIANLYLWAEIYTRFDARRMTATWVRGHVGTELNEEADRLAGEEARKFERLASKP